MRLIAILLLHLGIHSVHAQIVSSPDFSGIVAALDRDVAAIGNLTASNERTVGKLQDTATTVTASNDRNVDAITRSVDKLLPSVDGLGASAHDILDAWDKSMKPSMDSVTRVGSDAVARIGDVELVGRDALRKWDLSIKPAVDDVAKLGNDALDRWDSSLKPTVDSALAKFDDAISLIKNTLLPVVIIFVTLWVAMCTAGAVACCIVKKGRHAHSAVPAGIAIPRKATMPASFYNMI
jgi:chemotaxis regulatin CheY-phosphate phosphatase CheZ